jgi:hypothetical protein
MNDTVDTILFDERCDEGPIPGAPDYGYGRLRERAKKSRRQIVEDNYVLARINQIVNRMATDIASAAGY